MDQENTTVGYDPRIAGTKLAAPRMGAMTLQLEEQNMLTNQLNEAVERLFERVRPVWQSPNQKADGSTEADRAELPQHIEQISMHNRRIRQAISAINLMTDGLEL